MPHNLTPTDLHNNDRFELIEEVSYDSLKPFILRTINKHSRYLAVYGIIQFIAVVAAIIVLIWLLILVGLGKPVLMNLKWYLVGVIASITIIVPLHELLHALAFWVLGKRDIGFGMQLRKFIFYAEANRQVLDKHEMKIVAFTPLIVIGLTTLTASIIYFGSPQMYLFLAVFLLHFLFCAGDMAMVAFFSSSGSIYSYDDRQKRTSYFFHKKDSK